MTAIHLCITYRQLLMAICDSIKTGRHTAILFLTDYQNIDASTRNHLINTYSNIDFHFIREKKQIESFSVLPVCTPDILRRNLSFSSRLRPILPQHWTPNFLNEKRYDKGYIYHSGPFLAKVLRGMCSEIILREDGLSNYVTQPISIKKALLRACFGLPWRGQTWGDESWIHRIEAEYPEKLPATIRNKSAPLKISTLLESINEEQRKKLSAIFDLTQYVGLSVNKSCLILTQPIDLVGLCSEAEKIKIYTLLIENFQKLGYKVYLKHHPKEEPYLLKHAIVNRLPTAFPIELWPYITGHQFDYCIALCSTAIATTEIKIAKKITFTIFYFGDS